MNVTQLYDSEYKRLYSPTRIVTAKASRDDRIWEAASKGPNYTASVGSTIFQLTPTTVIIDEIHNRRKHPVNIYPLRDVATFVLGLSGTPLVTEPQV
jgi:superfamily II DNA or RNA helicase